MSGIPDQYILRSADTPKLQLVSDGDYVVLDYDVESDRGLWYFTSTGYESYFRLHTVANGDQKSLDVLNDNGTSSTNVYFAGTGDYTGQFWALEKWDDGIYRLSNSFTGPDVYLAWDSNGPYLYPGYSTTQHWAFVKADSGANSDVPSPSDVSATSVLAAITSIISTTTKTTPAPTLSPPANTSSHEKSISVGAIAGIAIGSLAALVLCVCAVIYILRRKRSKRVPTSAEQYPHSSEELVCNPPDYVAATAEKELASAHVAAQGKQGQSVEEWRNMPSAEVAGSDVQYRAEMP